MIQNAEEFRRPKSVQLQTGKGLEISILAPEYPTFSSLGLIKIEPPQTISGLRIQQTEVSLTPQGVDASTAWAKGDQGKTTEWTVPIATRRFGEVTGIRNFENGKARVEFTWSWIPNIYGQAIRQKLRAITELKEALLRDWEKDRGVKDNLFEKWQQKDQTYLLYRQLLTTHHVNLRLLMSIEFDLQTKGKSIEQSKIFRSAVEFQRYDDGWRVSREGVAGLKEALEKVEQEMQ